MAKYKLEYIWLDGYEPVANLRSKTQLKDFSSFPKLEELPWWGFDGSSTRQAEGKSSDCMLKPVAVYPDIYRPDNGALVMCEVYMPDKKTPHPTNARATILDDPDAWFGFEQEYFLYQDGAPLGFPAGGNFPPPRVSITPASDTRTSETWPEKSSRNTSTHVSTPASTTKASTPKWLKDNGNSQSSEKAPVPQPTRCGSPATSSPVCVKPTEWT